MDNQIVTILSLAPVYQILATFFVAFIVIEYAQSFTMIIAKHIFDIDGILNSHAEKAKVDKNSIQGELADERFTKGNGLTYKQKYLNEIDQYEESLKSAYKDVTEFKDAQFHFESFRYVSIYMFLYCMLHLYAGGCFEGMKHHIEVNFLLYETSISFLITMAYFILENRTSLFNTGTRMINFYISVSLLVFSVIITSILTWKLPLITEECVLLSSVIETLAALLPSFTFIVGFCFVYSKSHKVKVKIVTVYSTIQKKQSDILDKLTKTKNFVDVNKEIDNIEIESKGT